MIVTLTVRSTTEELLHQFRPLLFLEAARQVIRRHIAHLEEDRPLYPDHIRMKELVRSGEILEAVESTVGSLG